MTRWRRLLGPALGTAAMLAVLCGLGAWQLQRLQWKTALLARIDAAEAAPGVPLPDNPAPFEKVRVQGSFRTNIAGSYGLEGRDTAQGPQLGTQSVLLLDRPTGPPIVTVYGWLPRTTRKFVVRAGELTVEGYIRPPARPGLFSARDDLANRVFYTLNPAVIGAAMGVPKVAPFSLVLLGATKPGVYPELATAMPRPPNDHLQYAITWFGLAATLLVIFGIHARKVLSA